MNSVSVQRKDVRVYHVLRSRKQIRAENAQVKWHSEQSNVSPVHLIDAE